TADQGTVVYDPDKGHPKGADMENPIITGIAAELNEAKVTDGGVPDVPGKAAQMFEIVAATNANIDMIVQNVSAADTNRTDISFNIPVDDGRKVIDEIKQERDTVGYVSLIYDDQIAKIAVVGAGMRTNAGVSAKLFRA